MSADWTTCRVARAPGGALWEQMIDHRTLGQWAMVGSLGATLTAGGLADAFPGEIVPVLDAEGLPVVSTVGDLTARHIGRRVRVDYGGGEAETISVERVKHYGYRTNLGDGCGYLDLDTTCEVLP